MDRGHHEPGEGSRQQREDQDERRRPGRTLHAPEPHCRTDEHHSLDAEVEDAGAFGEQLAKRGEQDRRPVDERLDEDLDDERIVDVHYDASAAGTVSSADAARRPRRTR
jgi:hypothetical protein